MSGLDDASSDTWQSLVHEFRDKLGLNEPAGSEPTTCENDFRSALETLCSDNRERNPHREINRFRREHVQIINFVTAIDGTNKFEEEHALQPLIWQLMTSAAKAAFIARQRLRGITEVTRKLNDKVPRALTQNTDKLVKYPHETRIQKPLQQIFKEYMNCYLSMFSEFSSYPSVLCITQYEERVKSASDYFLPRTEQWEAALEAVEAERQRFLGSASVASGQYGSTGLPAPSLSARFNLNFVKHLGSGTYGDVSEVIESTTKVLYAQKMIRPRGRHDAGTMAIIEKQVRSEVEIMQKLRHHHIAAVLMCSQDGNAFYLIMHPVADYDLRYFLEELCVDNNFPRDQLRNLDNWFGCLISALTYAHNQRVKHEDIKPSNILIKHDRPYLSDFGSAKDFSTFEGGSTSPEQNIAGTPVYWSPESRNRGRSADVFSLGCVFSEMLTVRQKRSLHDYRDARQTNDTDFPTAFRKNLPAINDWMSRLPSVDQSETVQELLLGVIRDMLEEDPDQRPQAPTIKRRFRVEGERLFCASCS
ncbi:hypothetical protein PRZ48_008342 [Zasmidium cellare]|uniref:Protein kinase domain-containing protein n=1 Tax=Zasmidium cellare TaxID=395010 RepID=A0ABR0EFW5_ZASCE|nr:hypothetical protein PRZ48_008342 [Zasmidium cellare]